VRRYVAAMRAAVTFIRTQPKAARKILQAYTKMPPKIARIVPLPTWDYAVRTGDLAKWVGVLQDIGTFKGDVDPQKLVVPSAGRR
jgi:hypothetical protein